MHENENQKLTTFDIWECVTDAFGLIGMDFGSIGISQDVVTISFENGYKVSFGYTDADTRVLIYGRLINRMLRNVEDMRVAETATADDAPTGSDGNTPG